MAFCSYVRNVPGSWRGNTPLKEPFGGAGMDSDEALDVILRALWRSNQNQDSP